MIKLTQWDLDMLLGKSTLRELKNKLKSSVNPQYIKIDNNLRLFFRFDGSNLTDLRLFKSQDELLEYASIKGIRYEDK